MTDSGYLMTAPAELPPSPRPRWWRRGRPWQPSAGKLLAARALALEVASEVTYRPRDFEYVIRKGCSVGTWLTGAATEADMTTRYAATRLALANERRDPEWSPDPAEFIESAAGFARFLTLGGM